FTAQTLSLQNTAATVGFSEKLDASFSGTTLAATASGSFNLLAAGASDSTSLLVGLSGTGTAGAKTGTATVALTSDGTGSSGLATTRLTAQPITINGNVYRLAATNTIATPTNLATIHAADSFATPTLTLQNTAANDGFSEKLDASFSGTTGNATASGSFN